ncbi:MAG: hypothetical protein NTZ05_20390, partial [Chloroflexi bacterium]|nr:hypothetical protein [Chloroflexota bacterium]
GVPLLVLDPKTPLCDETFDWFADCPGGAYYGAQAWAIQHGYTQRGCKALVILQGYPRGHGEAGLSVGVVGYDVVERLDSGNQDKADVACGLLSHEVGHLLGLGHVSTPADLMSEIAAWGYWPRVGLSVLPA